MVRCEATQKNEWKWEKLKLKLSCKPLQKPSPFILGIIKAQMKKFCYWNIHFLAQFQNHLCDYPLIQSGLNLKIIFMHMLSLKKCFNTFNGKTPAEI